MSEITLEALPLLFNRSSTGAVLEWGASVVNRDGVIAIRVEFGQMDGEKQVQYKDVTEGKNIGKKNETTPARQAVLDVSSVWRKKKDHGYQEEIPGEAHCSFLPMLAHNYTDRAHNISMPAFVQPKLEGVRCLAVKTACDTMSYISRNGKKFPNLKYLDAFYLPILGVGEVVDGEIFSPGMAFEDIIHHLKSPRSQGEPLFHYVYDFPSVKGGFKDRIEELEKRLDLVDDPESPIQLVDTFEVSHKDLVLEWHEHFVKEGYEGLIIRNMEGEYRYDHRSKDLQKYKSFMDREFLIVGVEPAKGKDPSLGSFICKTPGFEIEFGAPFTGSKRLREDYLLNPDKYIGKRVTVSFQRLTERGVPYLPKARAVRDYE